MLDGIIAKKRSMRQRYSSRQTDVTKDLRFGDVVWRVSKPFNPNGEEWWLEMTLIAQSSTRRAMKEMLVLERRPPHRFFMIVGNPDDYVGVEFKPLAK